MRRCSSALRGSFTGAPVRSEPMRASLTRFDVSTERTGALQDRMDNRLIEAGQVTSDGLVAVEDLRDGMLVETMDRGLQPIQDGSGRCPSDAYALGLDG